MVCEGNMFQQGLDYDTFDHKIARGFSQQKGCATAPREANENRHVQSFLGETFWLWLGF